LEVLDTVEEVRDVSNAKPFPVNPSGAAGQVCFEKVTFGYETGRPVLKEATLQVKPGETLALVGPTGAGKSTLVSLILRLFDPWQGQVSIDDVDVRDIKLSSLRSNVALVLQEPFLLPLTVAENIAYGRPGASHDEVVAAATLANSHEFIMRLPEGYDTAVNERGATLSGGQKQRLAIARALLKNAPILILDEPTSALDADAETRLLDALERLMAGRTTFIIAHRLSTIRFADRIAVLDQGRITEIGSHQELLATDGQYQRLYMIQHGLQSPDRKS
jgi:ATP-binding cassette subfamily B protein/subfamily B ATP-binding cassette protein MsbA